MTPDELKETRKALGLTQQTTADWLEVDRVSVNRWEAGTNPVPGWAAKLLQFHGKTKAMNGPDEQLKIDLLNAEINYENQKRKAYERYEKAREKLLTKNAK